MFHNIYLIFAVSANIFILIIYFYYLFIYGDAMQNTLFKYYRELKTLIVRLITGCTNMRQRNKTLTKPKPY